jgi:large subunit ribosomal protein L10e|tara:strand:+ start:1132 stop:1656 length:525 start_codon:yes stop_codon:yes gene_type:complete
MAKIRKFVSYRRIERPYTRASKYKEKSFVRASSNIHVVGFELGNLKKRFQYTLKLISKDNLQIRDNALESAKQTSNKLLETNLGLSAYHLKLKPYPHHVLRENPLAAGAGADRFSTGMQRAFGKPMGNAAQIRKNDVIFHISVNKQNLELAKTALTRASKKLPGSCTIQVVENK